MNNFIFENATKTYFGRGCVKEYLVSNLKGYGDTVMIAYGGGSIKSNGIYELVIELLRAAGKNIVEFPGITPNPTYAQVLECAKLARDNGVDVILGVGGGSVIDCCKAAAMAAVYDGDLWNDYYSSVGIVYFEPLPLGVIVTVGGSGAEMNGGAVITNEKLKIKTGRDYPRCNPRFALMDPSYTFSVPRLQTASGGYDTLSHIMEIYFSRLDEDNISENISEALMRSVIANLPKALKEPENYAARSNLMWASTMAENRIIKLGKNTDFQSHHIAHQMGAYTGCNHGFAMAVVQPAYYRYIYKYGLDKFKRFAAEVWGVSTEDRSDEETALEGLRRLDKFIRDIGLPTTLGEIGISDEKIINEIAESAPLSQGGYKKTTAQDIKIILNNCK